MDSGILPIMHVFSMLSSPAGPFNPNGVAEVSFGGIDNGAGTVSGVNFLALSGNITPTTSYQLATIDIFANAVGTSLLTLSNPDFVMVNSVHNLPLHNFPVNLAVNNEYLA